MGFEFGVILDLDFTITLYCFVIVVAFVLIMEYVIGVMEYFLEGSKLYTNMIQMIYKELMLMGLVTFAVVMYEATPSGGISEEEEKWLEAIDFSHIYLFFVTFFFVLHAFYLMFTSMIAVTEYRIMFCEEIESVISDLEKALVQPFQSFLFSLNFFPQMTNLRDRAEFAMLHQLFMSRYLVPEDFDFPYYLSGCFDRFALRTIDRSKFTWIALVLIVVVNYFRVLAGLSCSVREYEDDEDRRRLGEEDEEEEIDACRKEQYYLFLVSGGLLVLYTVLLIYFTRLYKMRLIHQVNISGTECNSPADYITLLKLKDKKLDDEKECTLNLLRMPTADLRDAIQKEFDQNEEGEEDEEGFRFLGELLRTVVTEIHEKYIEFRIWLVKAITHCMSSTKSETETKTTKSILFAKSSDHQHHHHHHGEHHHHHEGHHHHSHQHGDVNTSNDTGSGIESPRSAADKPHGGPVEAEEEEYISLKYRLNSAVILAAVADVSMNNSRTSQDSNQPLMGKGPVEQSNPLVAGAMESKIAEDQLNNNRVIVDYDRLTKQHSELLRYEEKVKESSNCCACCHGGKFSLSHFSASVASLAESISFNNIYLFNRPVLYFRAVEMQIMLTCMYLALWSTSFITIVKDTGYNQAQHFFYQVLMLIPVGFAFRSIAYVAETCSLILAMSDLNLDVIDELLADKEDMEKLTGELREKMMHKIRDWFEQTSPDEEQQAEFVHQLFVEIDQDGSGSIDKSEFRLLLRKLNLKYSNHRFDLLFRALDSVGGDGEISEPELVEFLFPGCSSDNAASESADGSSESVGGKSQASESRKAAAWARSRGLVNFTRALSGMSSGSKPYLASESDDSFVSKEGVAMTSVTSKKAE